MKIKMIIKKYFLKEKNDTQIEAFVLKQPKNSYYFDNKESERNFLLKKTSSAFNDSFLINYLKHAILITEIEKRGPIKIEENRYKNIILKDIYEILCRFVPNTYYWKMSILIILDDMQENQFDKQPSMNRLSNPEYSTILNNGIEKRLDCFESIFLSTHLLNTIKTYLNHFSEQIDTFYYPKFEVIVACLLHDFGKSIKLQKKLDVIGVETLRHEEISGLYIDYLMKQIEAKYIFNIGIRDDEFYLSVNQFRRIKKAVIEHHKPIVEKGSLSELIKLIDYKTREKEYEDYEKQYANRKIR